MVNDFDTKFLIKKLFYVFGLFGCHLSFVCNREHIEGLLISLCNAVDEPVDSFVPVVVQIYAVDKFSIFPLSIFTWGGAA